MIEQLYDAAPYIGRFKDRVFVIKVGGEIILDEARLSSLARQVHVLWQIGVRAVLVHGGGPQLDRALTRQGHEPRKVNGRRITDEATLELAKQVFRGSTNLDLIAALGKQGLPAVGLSGADSGLLKVSRRPPVEVEGEQVDFGFVGDPVSVAPELLQTLLAARFVPAVCSLGVDSGGQVLNVNGDTVACELAVALEAVKLIYVTPRAGVLHDENDPSSIYSVLDPERIAELSAKGIVRGGMSPKLAAGTSALSRGVERVHIIGADLPDALLEEVFTNQGCGTMLVRSGGAAT